MFSLMIPCMYIEILEKRKSKLYASTKMQCSIQAYTALMKPAKYMTATVNEDFFKGTVYEEMYADTEIETKNKLSLNENGKCYVATEVEAWGDIEYSEYPVKILDGTCIKTKVNKYSDEKILIDICLEYNEKTKEDELKIDVLNDGYYMNDEIISEEFKTRAKELDKKTGGMFVNIYYIGNVAYIMLEGYKLNFDIEDLKDLEKVREYMKKEAEIIDDYIELANML